MHGVKISVHLIFFIQRPVCKATEDNSTE